jgi:hypothetical protein
MARPFFDLFFLSFLSEVDGDQTWTTMYPHVSIMVPISLMPSDRRSAEKQGER